MTRLTGSFILMVLIGILSVVNLIVPEERTQERLFTSAVDRRSITFIMGEDKTPQPFYALAAQHFALDAREKSDYVIHTCRTLGGVIDFLNTSPLRGTAPWSVVNIVAHGNPQTGLNLYIRESGHKATPKRLVQAALRGDIPDLQPGVADSLTKINIWSCGVGKSPLINVAMQQIFKSASGDSVQVYCSPHFVIFHPSVVGSAPRRLNASYWPYYFRRGYRPGNVEIAEALRRQYPDEVIAWDIALEEELHCDSDSVYHGEYHIPVSYLRIYHTKEERPPLETEAQKMQWVMSQPEINQQLEDAGIPIDKYHWTVNKIIHTTEDGSKVPAIKAIGMSTVLYVLKEES